MARSFAAALLTSWALSGCYVTRMALHHNDLFNSRRPVAEVIADPGTSETVRDRLSDVQRVLTFAETAGLNASGAYGYYIQTEEPVVSYLVQAAHPDRLEFVTWWFPVVGSVPYLGFFAASERNAKAAELASQGYDVHTTGVGAFSSLGWFEDPVFSSMIARGEADLAHLFFHELTHRTLWVRGTVEFNENLAEYVASILTRAYLAETGRAGLIPGYEAKLGDRLLFRGWLRRLKDELSATYERLKGEPRPLVLAAKRDVIQGFLEPAQRPAFAAVDFIKGEEWNNASILGAVLYAPDLARFERAHRCVGGERPDAFLKALGRATEDLRDGSSSEPAFKALDGLCAPRK